MCLDALPDRFFGGKYGLNYVIFVRTDREA